jgi:hypothetical protein
MAGSVVLPSPVAPQPASLDASLAWRRPNIAFPYAETTTSSMSFIMLVVAHVSDA